MGTAKTSLLNEQELLNKAKLFYYQQRESSHLESITKISNAGSLFSTTVCTLLTALLGLATNPLSRHVSLIASLVIDEVYRLLLFWISN